MGVVERRSRQLLAHVGGGAGAPHVLSASLALLLKELDAAVVVGVLQHLLVIVVVVHGLVIIFTFVKHLGSFVRIFHLFTNLFLGMPAHLLLVLHHLIIIRRPCIRIGIARTDYMRRRLVEELAILIAIVQLAIAHLVVVVGGWVRLLLV